MKWSMKLYQAGLRHKLLLNKKQRDKDIRRYAARIVLMDHFLINTRKDIRSEDSVARDWLDERFIDKGYYDC